MGKFEAAHLSQFQLEGRFLRFVVEDGYKLKRMWIATPEGECCIKLSKESRASVGRVLMPGDWVRVTGRRKTDGKTGEVKLKADLILPTAPRSTETSIPQPATPKTAPTKGKANILMCQKSDCMKRGGRAVCHALEQALDDRGLGDSVAIKPTGCMKHCKAGPNIVMPDKTRYSRISAAEVPDLLEKHFPSDVQEAEENIASEPVEVAIAYAVQSR
jgi:(2Fe-2S) ferredoxin